MAPGKYFDRNEAAAYLQSCGVRYTRGTLNTYAHAGKGPAYRIVGNGRGKAIYSMRDLDAFIKSMTQPYAVTPKQAAKTKRRAATPSTGAVAT